MAKFDTEKSSFPTLIMFYSKNPSIIYIYKLIFIIIITIQAWWFITSSKNFDKNLNFKVNEVGFYESFYIIILQIRRQILNPSIPLPIPCCNYMVFLYFFFFFLGILCLYHIIGELLNFSHPLFDSMLPLHSLGGRNLNIFRRTRLRHTTPS